METVIIQALCMAVNGLLMVKAYKEQNYKLSLLSAFCVGACFMLLSTALSKL